jgi:hypothetical protein
VVAAVGGCVMLSDPGPGGGGPGTGGNPQVTADGGSTDAGVLVDGGSAAQLPSANSATAITVFLQAGKYQAWTREAAVHGSVGAHGQVRVYVNDALRGSLKANATVHPRGSAAVAELYDSSQTTLLGQAFSMKVAGATGDEWVFFEGQAPSYNAPTYVQGVSNPCWACHSGNGDAVWTSKSSLP